MLKEENTLHGERNRVEKKLQHFEAHYRALMGNLAFGICRCGIEGQFVDVNRALVTMLGYASKEELLGLNLAADILHDPSKRAQLLGEVGENGRVDPLETVWSRKNGTSLTVRLSGREVNTEEGKRDGYEIIVEDVTKQREIEDQLRQQAARDPLTGLANYRHLLGVLDSEIKRFKRTGREFALLFFDLDRLKQINDRYGHLTGSEALCRLADVLPPAVGILILQRVLEETSLRSCCPKQGWNRPNRLPNVYATTLQMTTEEPKLSVSAGVAIYPTDGETVEALLLAADKALYGKKSRVHDRARITD